MQTKICPQCGAEYFSHVDVCADCHIELKDSQLIEKENAEKERFLRESAGELVPLREGGSQWLKELRHVLLEKGIETCISLSPGCKPGNCNATSLLFVCRKDLEHAQKYINEYYLSVHPEVESIDDATDETCPACGYHTPEGVKECPDCGLVLIVD